MKLFIEFEIGKQENPAAGDSWLHFASSMASDLLGTGLESRSETVVADMVGKLVSQSEKVFMLVSAYDSGEPTGCLEVLLQHIVNAAKPVMIVLAGVHEASESILEVSGISTTRTQDEDRIRQLIREFAQ